MIDSSANTLFQLLRSALGTQSAEWLPADVDWQEVIDLAFEQGVASIAVDGLQFSLELKAESLEVLDSAEIEDLKYEWFASTFEAEDRNREVSQRASELYEFFSRNGFRSCVLKGQGLAQLYPVPEHRTSGDIDLWVEGGREKVLDFIRSKGYNVTHVDVKHSDVEFFDNVPVEIHFLPSYTFDPLCWRRLKKWAGRQIGIQAAHYDLKVGFAYPTIEFNLVYVLHHIYRHIFNEGVGLRQVTDYACAMLHSEGCNREEVWKVIGALKMRRFASGMMWVMKECYHIDQALLLCEPCAKEGRFLLNEFLHGGSFGRYDSRHSLNYSNGTLFRGIIQFRRNLTFLTHYPNEVLWSPIWKLWHWFARKFF